LDPDDDPMWRDPSLGRVTGEMRNIGIRNGNLEALVNDLDNVSLDPGFYDSFDEMVRDIESDLCYPQVEVDLARVNLEDGDIQNYSRHGDITEEAPLGVKVKINHGKKMWIFRRLGADDYLHRKEVTGTLGKLGADFGDDYRLAFEAAVEPYGVKFGGQPSDF